LRLDCRKDCIRQQIALKLVPDVEAAVVRGREPNNGIERRDDGVAALAAYCLGATGSPRAFDALREALPRALFRGDFELARELVRAFARFGRSEAAPDLAAILARKSLLKRRLLRELKLTAIDVLAKLPGSAALQALAVAGESRDAQIREAARRALARRPAPSAA
jgi:HEAT repeat protein